MLVLVWGGVDLVSRVLFGDANGPFYAKGSGEEREQTTPAG